MDINPLTSIPLVSKLSPDELTSLRQLLTRQEIAVHKTVCWIGESGTDFWIVQSGRVEIVQPDEEGKEIVLNSLGPGGFFGELSLLDGGPRTATVRTTTDSVFLTLGREEFLNFLKAHPAAAIQLLSEMGKRQRNMLQMLRGIKNANRVMAERQTFGQHFADGFVSRMGSWTFIIVQTIVFMLWILTNEVADRMQWDPYPFNLLALVFAAVSGYAAPLILMSQARQSEKDRIRAELEYQVNVKAHHEVMQLHRKIDHLAGLLAKRQEEPAASR